MSLYSQAKKDVSAGSQESLHFGRSSNKVANDAIVRLEQAGDANRKILGGPDHLISAPSLSKLQSSTRIPCLVFYLSLSLHYRADARAACDL